MKRSFIRLPLYLGLAVMVASVLISAMTVGQRGSITSLKSRASSTDASLSLRFVSPNMINISLVSQKPIAGIDVALQYDKDKVTVMPSTLTSGPSFTTTGGIADETNGTFSFSAIARNPSVSSGIVATFQVVPKQTSVDALFQFVETAGKTAVLDQASGNTMTVTTEGVKAHITAQ